MAIYSLKRTYLCGFASLLVITVLISITYTESAFASSTRLTARIQNGSTHTPTQSMAFAYWSEEGNMSSRIVLNNAIGNNTVMVFPVLYSHDGQAITVKPFTLDPRQQLTINIAQWLAESSAPANVTHGSLVVGYDAPQAYYLGAQVTIVDQSHSLSFDVPAEMPMGFVSSQLEGIGWQEQGSDSLVIVTNTGDDRLMATISFPNSDNPEAPLSLINEPPAYYLHDWSEGAGFTSQCVLVGDYKATPHSPLGKPAT